MLSVGNPQPVSEGVASQACSKLSLSRMGRDTTDKTLGSELLPDAGLC